MKQDRKSQMHFCTRLDCCQYERMVINTLFQVLEELTPLGLHVYFISIWPVHRQNWGAFLGRLGLFLPCRPRHCRDPLP